MNVLRIFFGKLESNYIFQLRDLTYNPSQIVNKSSNSASVFISFPSPALPSHHSFMHIIFSLHVRSTSAYFCCTFFGCYLNFVVPLILSFLILSSFVTPHKHIDILISATSDFFSCALISLTSPIRFFNVVINRHVPHYLIFCHVFSHLVICLVLPDVI